MKKVYGSDVIGMLSRGNVVVLSGWDYPEEDCLPMVLYRSRRESDNPKVSVESFPIIVPEVGGVCHSEDVKGWGVVKEAPVSTCETSGDFIDKDDKYIVFSKEDVESWKEKLEDLLTEYA